MKSHLFISKDNSEKIHNITVEEGHFSSYSFLVMRTNLEVRQLYILSMFHITK